MRTLALVLATFALAGCGSGGPSEPAPVPKAPPLLEQTKDGNFTLYVSNQSFERANVDITVAIDGQPAVDADFDVGNEHNWVEFKFQLADGEHTLRAESREGEAVLEKRFEVEGKRWAVVDYWCCNGASEPRFTFLVRPTPIAFA